MSETRSSDVPTAEQTPQTDEQKAQRVRWNAVQASLEKIGVLKGEDDQTLSLTELWQRTGKRVAPHNAAHPHEAEKDR